VPEVRTLESFDTLLRSVWNEALPEEPVRDLFDLPDFLDDRPSYDGITPEQVTLSYPIITSHAPIELIAARADLLLETLLLNGDNTGMADRFRYVMSCLCMRAEES